MKTDTRSTMEFSDGIEHKLAELVNTTGTMAELTQDQAITVIFVATTVVATALMGTGSVALLNSAVGSLSRFKFACIEGADWVIGDKSFRRPLGTEAKRDVANMTQERWHRLSQYLVLLEDSLDDASCSANLKVHFRRALSYANLSKDDEHPSLANRTFDPRQELEIDCTIY